MHDDDTALNDVRIIEQIGNNCKNEVITNPKIFLFVEEGKRTLEGLDDFDVLEGG